jgi:hypothetical protein
MTVHTAPAAICAPRGDEHDERHVEHEDHAGFAHQGDRQTEPIAQRVRAGHQQGCGETAGNRVDQQRRAQERDLTDRVHLMKRSHGNLLLLKLLRCRSGP